MTFMDYLRWLSLRHMPGFQLKTNTSRVAFLAMLLLLPLNASTKNLYKERHYQDIWCVEQRGICEVVLPDRTRYDCVTDNYAVEFDFGKKKWAEAIGQSLYYALQTGTKAGIVLTLEKPSDYKYWIRLNTVIDQNDLPITTWIAEP
jgi:hypothetical protein